MKKLFLMVWVATATALINSGYAATNCIPGTGTNCEVTTTVEVEILPGNICIGSDGDFDFGTYTVSSSPQTVNGAFVAPDGYFWVDDLKGDNDGYYTTVQLNADLAGPGTATIPRANAYVQTPSVGNAGITTMSGSANTRVEVHAGMTTYQSLDVARQLIIRNTATNDGVVGKYGVLPQLQLVIPAYQSVGTYTATLTYTIYEN